MALTDQQKTSKLFKKNLGVSETSTARDFFEEPDLSPNAVFIQDIWSESDLIPSTAPSLPDLGESGVVRYYEELTLVGVPGAPNAYRSPNGELQDTIPFNYSDGSYNYTLRTQSDANIAFGANDWILDPVAGVLYFYGGNPSGVSHAQPPKISFYKYIGDKGVNATTVTESPIVGDGTASDPITFQGGNKTNIAQVWVWDNDGSDNNWVLKDTYIHGLVRDTVDENDILTIREKEQYIVYEELVVEPDGEVEIEPGGELVILSGETSTPASIFAEGSCVGSTLRVGSGTASAYYSGVLGGCGNTASGLASTVVGGVDNEANQNYSSISGGRGNITSGFSSFVGGGYQNTASADYSVVAGGSDNLASGNYSSVLSGRSNVASDMYSSVASGYCNLASGNYSSVSSGRFNVASGNYSSVLGGACNIASATHSSVLGGRNLESNVSFAAMANSIISAGYASSPSETPIGHLVAERGFSKGGVFMISSASSDPEMVDIDASMYSQVIVDIPDTETTNYINLRLLLPSSSPDLSSSSNNKRLADGSQLYIAFYNNGNAESVLDIFGSTIADRETDIYPNFDPGGGERYRLYENGIIIYEDTDVSPTGLPDEIVRTKAGMWIRLMGNYIGSSLDSYVWRVVESGALPKFQELD